MMQRRILVLQDSEFRPVLKRALEPSHNLEYCDRVNDALTALRSGAFDLIISQVYLKEDDMFDFLLQVEEDPDLADIPFICIAMSKSDLAHHFNFTLSLCALKMGAASYLEADNFCNQGRFDYEALRESIESVFLR